MNLCERLVVMSDTEVIDVGDLPPNVVSAAAGAAAAPAASTTRRPWRRPSSGPSGWCCSGRASATAARRTWRGRWGQPVDHRPQAQALRDRVAVRSPPGPSPRHAALHRRTGTARAGARDPGPFARPAPVARFSLSPASMAFDGPAQERLPPAPALLHPRRLGRRRLRPHLPGAQPRHRRGDRPRCRGWAPPRRAQAIEAAAAALPAWRARTAQGARRHPPPVVRAHHGQPGGPGHAHDRASRASRWPSRAARSPTPPRSSSGSARRPSASTATPSRAAPAGQADRGAQAAGRACAAAITPWNFPVGDDHPQGRPGAGRRLHHGGEAGQQPRRSRRWRWRSWPSRRGHARRRLQRRHRRLAAAIGGELTSNPIVRKLSFTGSTEVGKLLMAQCAGDGEEGLAGAGRQRALHRLRRRRPRRGGRGRACSPSTATPARPASAPTASWCRTASTTPSSGSFAEAVGELQGRRRPARPTTQQGPLIDEAGGREGRGARRRRASPRAPGWCVGGARHALGGTFFEPTVLTGVTPEMADVAGGDLRAGRRLFRFADRGRGASGWPTTPSSAWPPTSTAATSARVWRVARGPRVRHGRHQHRPHLHRGRALRRHEGVGHRTRGLEVRHRGLSRDQVRLHGRDR